MISVLMSVYNETHEEIRESIDSVLSQSYSDFELIVVLDKPSYTEGLEQLREYEARDRRVRVLVNEKNIGLALSMNRAAENARGEYFLRMDADDVCLEDRFLKQYAEISSGKYDLVCGNYDFINENGEPLPQTAAVYNDRQLEKLLPYRNIIHHPTVIMTREIFERVGGYRNYPCAQDYDLWLRMKCAGCRMHMMDEELIKYRVREASITVSKRYKQSCTGEYIRSLYKNKMEGYSYEGYLAYLDKRGVNDPGSNEDFIKNFGKYMEAKRDLGRGRLIRGTVALLGVIFKSKYYRPHVLRNARVALMTKRLRGKGGRGK
ncbi:MAG: glycosyltransferase [Clostridia bacterium]|nr:glycosyltransferase [Clostridia bacterium]